MNNPLAYFEELLSSDQSLQKKRKMISDYLEFNGTDILSIDDEKGIIKERRFFYNEKDNDWVESTGTLSFESSFKQEIEKESKILKEYILNKTLEISSTGVSSETFLQQISSKFQLYTQKADLYYSKYPFVKLQIADLSHFISEQLPTPGITKLPVSKKSLVAIPILTTTAINVSETPHNHKYSFNWDGFEEEEKIIQIKKLYQLLLQAPPIISADEEDFIRAFTQQNVSAGISWQLEGKSRLTNVASMCYLVHKLNLEGFIEDFSSTDFGKKLNYVFRDKDGLELKPNSLKSSLSDFRKTFTCDHAERIDDIIEEILQ